MQMNNDALYGCPICMRKSVKPFPQIAFFGAAVIGTRLADKEVQ